VKQIKEMTAEFNADALAPCEEANIGFATLPTLAKDCQEVGEVYLKACAEISYATGKGLEVAMVNEKATASVYALDHHGKPYARNIDRMTCELTSENDAKAIEGSIRKVKDNQYEISYCPKSLGRHRLHIKFDGKNIKASPFVITVGVPNKKFETPIMTITGLRQPWGVTVNKKGEIIIAENGAHMVSVYSQAGEKLRSFGSKGTGEGQFDGPRGVVIDDDDNILVADGGNHRIQKFTADGKFIIAMGSYGSKPLQFNLPTGIAVHPENQLIYVSESLNRRVQILKPNLAFHKLFGSRGSDKGQFQEPRGIAFDSKQNVYVGECRMNACIQVFTQEGEHLQWLGDTKLNCHFDVCIDSNDIPYVCDTNNHRICIFDSSGTLLHCFGTKGKSPGQFNSPYGITVDKNGLLYVSDYSNGRVQIF
jgi:DNA-binding beta-propeller fold protein YncE